MSRSELQEEWVCSIALYKASDISRKKWSQVHHVSIHRLKYWLYKDDKLIQAQDPKPKWCPVTVEDELIIVNR